MDPADLEGRLLFAIPKKGRLHEQCLQLLAGADIQFTRRNRLDIALSTNLPIALVFLNASDIAKFVGEGNVDIGITGQDMCKENAVVVEELVPLGFGKCQLQVQVPISAGYKSIDELIGKRIVTSFTNITKSYFDSREQGKTHDEGIAALSELKLDAKPNTKVTYVGGSVEAACSLGLADAIVDLVESGETMRAAKLTPIATLLTTQAVLICNPSKHQSNALIEKIKTRIVGVLTAQKYVLTTYNILRKNLPRAAKITPGKKAPTLSPLEDENWVAVSSMVLKKEVVQIMDDLTAIGAEDIMVMEIHNCRIGH
ncbi:ATP phosphoribosyltransferase (ATP-PRTase) (ATP-PRT) [Terramyces sp. JEL0728]|nr:ATP phosphoribosyltransferase (ATP-PRTase) (ATP-PRT) [Terramyces sp. JEL0728]